MGFFKWLFGTEDEVIPDRKKRVFISFAIEDKQYRDFLVEQARKSKSPFEFIDMSAKKPWKQSEWQKRCRTKIKRCDGVIVLLSKKTFHASGVRWEMKCANEEEIKMVGMHIKRKDKGAIPPELKGKRIIEWNWEDLAEEIDRF